MRTRPARPLMVIPNGYSGCGTRGAYPSACGSGVPNPSLRRVAPAAGIVKPTSFGAWKTSALT
ncbi:hypothetical protein [Kribbella sp. NPDC000426]|uniref:hypothetical protein n=1 Tax=Kribbella sp. NPDC000426 TaxID=3154255 RepID=UPI003330650D